MHRLPGLAGVLLGFALEAQSAYGAAIGNWDLSPWNYSSSGSPSGITTTVIQSNGSPSVGLQATTLGSSGTFLSGTSSGQTIGGINSNVPPVTQYSYSYSETFNFSSPVNFGATSTQSQYGSGTSDNGIGLQVRTDDSAFIVRYRLVFGLSGGAIFTAFGGIAGGFGAPSGLGTATVTLDWLGAGGADQVTARFDHIWISGNVGNFTLSHEVTYQNTTAAVLNGVNLTDVKINTLTSVPEPGTFAMGCCGLSAACAIRPKRRRS